MTKVGRHLALAGEPEPLAPASQERPNQGQADDPPLEDSLGLSQVKPCQEVSIASDLGRKLTAAKVVMVDGRCDSEPDTPTGAYSGPNQGTQVLEQLANGRILTAVCAVQGQERGNIKGIRSTVWIRYTTRDGQEAFVPAIWVKGDGGLKICD